MRWWHAVLLLGVVGTSTVTAEHAQAACPFRLGHAPHKPNDVHLPSGRRLQTLQVYKCPEGEGSCQCVPGATAGSKGCGPGPVVPAHAPKLAQVVAQRRRALSVAADATQYISERQFNRLFKHRDNPACSPGFYTYEAFKQAVAAFPTFATASRNPIKNKRELAAFLAQIAQETTGGWPSAPNGPYAWGLCFKEAGGNSGPPASDFCVPSPQWPCAPGKQYYGRGPIQLSFNYNYGAAGQALGLDLLNNPELVSSDAVVAFKTALWFWMTPQAPKPSAHVVMQGTYVPSQDDLAAGRSAGFGLVTNIINDGDECGNGAVAEAQAGRIGHYLRFCKMLSAGPGPNRDCANQRPF